MKLVELNPHFVKVIDGVRTEPTTVEGSDSITFDCPKCKTHEIDVIFSHETGKGWSAQGNYDTLTISPSVLHKCYNADWSEPPQEPRYCESHFFVRNGAIEMC